MSYLLGTTPEIHFTDDSGKLAAGGKMHFKRDTARDQDLAVYQDPGGLVPFPNPIELSGTGSVGLIYYTDAENYYIYLNDSTDSQLIWEVEHFAPPQTGSGPTPIESFIDIENLIPNAQLRFTWDTVVFNNLTDEPPTSLAPFFYFHKSHATGTDNIVITNFAQDRSGLEGDPTRYLNFKCTDAGSAKSYKDIEIRIAGVNTFNNRSISIAFQGRSPTTSTIEVMYKQHFGTGGSPSADVITGISSQVLTATFAKYSYINTTIATTGGKVIGTNGDDYFALVFRMPLAATAEVDLTNWQINIGAKIHNFEYDPYPRSDSENLPKLLSVNDNVTRSGSVLVGHNSNGTFATNVRDQIDRLGRDQFLSDFPVAVLSGSNYTATQNTTFSKLSALQDFTIIAVQFDTTNPASSTLNVNATGARPLVDIDGSPLPAGYLNTDQIYLLSYVTTLNSYRILSPGKATSGALGTTRFATTAEVQAGSSGVPKVVQLEDILKLPGLPRAWISFIATSDTAKLSVHDSYNCSMAWVSGNVYRITLSQSLTTALYPVIADVSVDGAVVVTPVIGNRTSTTLDVTVNGLDVNWSNIISVIVCGTFSP